MASKMKAKRKPFVCGQKPLGKNKPRRCKVFKSSHCPWTSTYEKSDCDRCHTKLVYEQGKSDGRKQTLEEVLKQWKNMSWNVAHLLFEYGAYKKYKFAIIALKEVDVIVQEKKSELEHKIKELSKNGK